MLVGAVHLAHVFAAATYVGRCGQACAPHEAARVAVLGRGASTPVIDVIVISNHGHHESHLGDPLLVTTVRKTSLLGRGCESNKLGGAQDWRWQGLLSFCLSLSFESAYGFYSVY